MAAQAALIADTIAGMKRVIGKHEHSSVSDEPYLQTSNRGNKLKRKSCSLEDGQLGRMHGPKIYKTSIEHGGYQRSILSRNPLRYDEDGDELADSDSDEEADARAADENPYADIRLEHLLLPIVSAASLPDHPSLSLAYSSPGLTDMAQHAGETAQQERKMLANAKRLTTKLRGDHTWMPCELLCSNRDEVMFNTERFYNGAASCRPSRKANGFGTQTLLNSKAKAENMSDSRKSSTSATELGSSSSVTKESNKEFVTETSFSRETAATNGEPSAGYATKEGPKGAATQIRHEEGDVEMTEDSHSQTVPNDSETVERMIEDEVVDIVGPEISSTAGLHQLNAAQQETGATSMEDEQANGVVGSHPIEGEISIDNDHGSISITEKSPRNHLPTPEADRPGNEGSEEGNDGHDASQPVPRRMRTRAQAQAASEPTASRNDSPESWVPPEIHPLFKTPELAIPDKNFGLPPDEAHDTRRLLTMYVQKQEEVCRGAEKLYNGLLHADWQRRMVLKWCKAEAHVGEMSDGEDWYDKEEWGLEEDLVKGHDDEDGDTNAIQGKKTRGRRA